MTVIEDMCEITLDHAGEKLRYFVRGHPDEATEVLHLRADLEWNDRRASEVESELMEIVASESYEYLMDADNVNQIIKVADTKILFTGFVQDAVVVAAFDRGVFPVLPAIVDDFRAYMTEHDVDFISLEI